MALNIKSFIADDGVEIRYADEGSGPVMIYQYGMGSSLDMTEGFIDLLKKYFRIIV